VDRDTLEAFVEAVLLTAQGPVAALTMVEAVDDREVTVERVEKVLETMRIACDQPGRGMRVERVAGGWRCATPPQLDPYLRALHGVQARQRLSQAALEVLSIVAHRQPVTLPEINFIRATNSSGVVRTLMDRKLVRVSGRKKVVGKPFLYRTTKDFLVHFGLDRIEDLPEPEEFEESALPAD
jgi:segregation and condensation protein B